MRDYVSGILFCAVMIALFLMPRSLPAFGLPFLENGSLKDEFTPGTMLFVGDIMLGREVERIMDREGIDYPFREINNFVSHVDVAVGNFEAAIPSVHKETPDFNFQLSAEERTAEVVRSAGFDVLSLANNHSHDFGSEGLTNTTSVLKNADLITVGHPANKISDVAEIVTVGSSKVAILAFHTVVDEPDNEVLAELVATASTKSDLQIAYVHFGTEYESVHDAKSEKFAHALIDAGVDAVIGHHPHVVQDIELYKERPIFYSLGNFVFDQYFSDEVQTGLTVKLEITPDALRYTLAPVSSKGNPSQPHLMGVDEKVKFLENVIGDSEIKAHIVGGTLVVPR